jgi:hypothetical protein
MEAGGVEPPSRDISGLASTCLVDYLRFAPQTAKRQAVCFASSLKFRRSATNIQNRYPAIGALVKPAGKNLTGRAALCSQFILVVAS